MLIRPAILSLLLFASVMPVAALAQLARPSPLPVELSPSAKSELTQMRLVILRNMDALRLQIDVHNQRCGSVPDTNTTLVISCEQSRSTLSQKINAYRNELATYEQSLRLAVQTAPALVPPDSMVVDARNVPTGLPKSVEDDIPNTPAGNRVRKGFQAIMDHDWKAARAWFQDALRQEPDDAGLKRLTDFAEYMVQNKNLPRPTHSIRTPNADDKAQIAATTAALGHLEDDWLGKEMAEALLDYSRNGLRKQP